MTRGDLLTLRPRDLNPWAGPKVVEVDEAALKKPRRDTLAYYRARKAAPGSTFPGAVDFDPPLLPEPAEIHGGSILPPKQDGTEAVIEVEGSVPDTPVRQPAGLTPSAQEFSIE